MRNTCDILQTLKSSIEIKLYLTKCKDTTCSWMGRDSYV